VSYILSWAKGHNVKDIHKEMLPVYGWKCLSRKAVHNWIEIFSQGYSKVADNETELRKWLKQQSKDFYAAGFDALVKQWDKCITVAREHSEK
jgi:thiamine kinase-like enzyme